MNRQLIDELRAVNPVPHALPVPIDDVWRKVDANAGSDPDIDGLVPGRRAHGRRRGVHAGIRRGSGYPVDGAESPMQAGVGGSGRRRSRAAGAIALTASVAIVVAVIVVVLVGHDGSSETSKPSTPWRSAVLTTGQTVARVNPRVAVDFSVLTSPPTAGDALPSADKAALSLYRAERPDVSGARRVTLSNGQVGYLVPTDGGACAVSAFAPICAPAALLPAAFSLDLCSPTLPAGRIEIQWLLPDGATDVNVLMTNGTVVRFASGYNIYLATIRNRGSSPRSINWDQAGHHHSVLLGRLAAQGGGCAHPG
jgi:hypothetical protein